MVTHTAGPWLVSNGSDQLVGSADKWIASTMGVRGDEGAANAHLIAAAPDLLALAHQYRNDLRHPPSADSITRRLAAIDAVLAKVTGDA